MAEAGGVSKVYPMPDWQDGPGVHSAESDASACGLSSGSCRGARHKPGRRSDDGLPDLLHDVRPVQGNRLASSRRNQRRGAARPASLTRRLHPSRRRASLSRAPAFVYKRQDQDAVASVIRLGIGDHDSRELDRQRRVQGSPAGDFVISDTMASRR